MLPNPFGKQLALPMISCQVLKADSVSRCQPHPSGAHARCDLLECVVQGISYLAGVIDRWIETGPFKNGSHLGWPRRSASYTQ